MKRIIASLLLVAAAGFAFGQAVPKNADQIAKEKALSKQVVDATLASIKAVGLEETIKLVNAKDARFLKGDVYAVINGYDGSMPANAGNPKLAGMKFSLDLKDAKGNPMRMIEIAKANPQGGEFEYWFSHPTLGKVLKKWCWIKEIPGANGYVSVGIYLEN